jgi:uncharacterized phiE125 gp8 family phage protein
MSGVIGTTLTVITPNTTAPLDLDYVRLHVKAVSDVEDELLESWVLAARDYWEEQTGRPIMRAVFEYWLDAFPAALGSWPSVIEMPMPPLVSVDSVSYVSADGTVLGFTDGASPESNLWQASAPAGTYARRGSISPLSGSVWPTPRVETGAVRIRFTAGYATTTAQVPAIIKATLLLLVGQFEQFRSLTHHSEGSRLEQVQLGGLSVVDQMISQFKYTALPSQILRSVWP